MRRHCATMLLKRSVLRNPTPPHRVLVCSMRVDACECCACISCVCEFKRVVSTEHAACMNVRRPHVQSVQLHKCVRARVCTFVACACEHLAKKIKRAHVLLHRGPERPGGTMYPFDACVCARCYPLSRPCIHHVCQRHAEHHDSRSPSSGLAAAAHDLRDPHRGEFVQLQVCPVIVGKLDTGERH